VPKWSIFLLKWCWSKLGYCSNKRKGSKCSMAAATYRIGLKISTARRLFPIFSNWLGVGGVASPLKIAPFPFFPLGGPRSGKHHKLNCWCVSICFLFTVTQSSFFVFLCCVIRLWRIKMNINKTRCKAKPDCNPPVYPLADCSLLLTGQLIGSPASVESGNLFTCSTHSNCPSCRMPAAPP